MDEPGRGPAGSGRVGLVVARPVRMLGTEPYFMEFVAGIEERLAARGVSVILHLVATPEEEAATYRRWADRCLVDAVIVVNLTADDERPRLLRALGLPAVLAGTWDGPPDPPAVRTDDAAPVREAVDRLVELGHRDIARVSGPARLRHTVARTAALTEACHEAGLPEPTVVEGDYSHESGARLTAELLRGAPRPTAILYDNDAMAVAGLAAARELRVPVPERLSLVAWDDSVLCQLATPPLSAMSVDVYQYGSSVARSVLELLDGGPVEARWSPTARFVARGSTAPART
ncbi:LacI family DNA-binding transcriptional regulator [Nocardiopsis sp. NRRL B-16309]|uniref:LacI family DNA-binding transcriptional regulator n=1 Tax=Nocardiopsis sp. NRRL B-16309 TaxID=1519494 RepID=UPI0006AFD4B1|nr:substrate-binding domain-containing protein [Nocardiopsis sp. NRRL B-16309]KOX08834.1 LacI family transcriptional regulator [Nocardiopsis sp. NRRL B-16309]